MHAPFTWQAQLINYNETWTLNVSDLNPGTIGGGYWMFVTRLFIGATTVDQITHDYCVNSDTFSCNGSVGNNTGGKYGWKSTNEITIQPISDCSTNRYGTLTVNVTIDDCITQRIHSGLNYRWSAILDSIVWIDPEVAVGYDYIVYGGPKISCQQLVGYGRRHFRPVHDRFSNWLVFVLVTNIDVEQLTSSTHQQTTCRFWNCQTTPATTYPISYDPIRSRLL